MKKYISKFHYLTQDLPHRSHVEQVQLACKAGANWIQYRCLTKNDLDLVKEIHEIASICDDWGATLILTEHYHLLNQVDAQGVHMEDMKADFKSIREQIGEDKTLGASANSFEDIERIALLNVIDYIGCGPFSITQTKPNTHSLLGIEGYKNIIQKMKKAGIDIPVLAVGGVKITDVEELIETGINGIAVSSAVNHANDPGMALKDFYKKIY